MNSRTAHRQKLAPKISKVALHLMSGQEFFLSFEEIVFFLNICRHLSKEFQKSDRVKSVKRNVRGNNDEKICHYSSCCLL